MSLVKIGWGKRQDGQFIHVTESERGKKCNCKCPECDTPLIARQGGVMSWHFAHAQPVECYGESVLHKVAKQIIVDAAGTSKSFLIPSLQKDLSSFDLTGQTYVTSWQIEEKNVLIKSAEEEKRFDNGQIADVLITTNSQKYALAVEIFVTHKKSDFDIQKFSEIRQDVVEIVLSNIDPLADRNTLEEQVLLKADRYWLFNQEENYYQQSHNEKLEKLNQSYFKEMVDLAISAIETHQLTNLKFVWPQLSKQVHEKGPFGEILYGEALQTPKITKLNASNSYSLTEYGCITDAIVENKAKVNVCFTLLDTEFPVIDKNKPLLTFEYSPREKEFYLSWFQIMHWKARLADLAQKDLERKLQIEQSKYYNQISYAKNFVAKSDSEKIEQLANDLSLSAPRNAGQYLNQWNTTWHVWKALVWKYKILRRQGGIIDVQHISDDDWFEQLLSWPQTPEAQEQRSKNIWFWFSRDLEKLGIIQHQGNMLFSVSRSLPKNFIPWAKRT